MKSILWKELKSLRLVSAGIFLVLCAYGVVSNTININFGQYPNLGIPNTSWPLPVLVWAAPFVALVFGYVQFFAEDKVGKSSFLIQRPVSMAAIYIAKATAGLGLVIVITGIPFICQELWRIYSDRFPLPAHWEWQASLICLGFSCLTWSAGAMAGMPLPGVLASEWWKRRVIPIVGLLPLFYLERYGLLLAPFYIVSAFARWASYGDNRKAGPLSFIAISVLNGGAGLVFLVALVMLIANLMPQLADRDHLNYHPEDHQLYYHGSAYSITSGWEYAPKVGRFFSVNEFDGLDTWHYLGGKVESGNHPINMTRAYQFLPIDLSQDLRGATSAEYGSKVSIYDSADNVYKQYDEQSGKLVSVLDNNGFTSASRLGALHPFKNLTIGWEDDLATNDSVEDVTYPHSSIHRVFKTSADENIVRVFSARDALTYNLAINPRDLIIVTTRRVVIIDSTDKIRSSWNLPVPAKSISQVAIYGDLLLLTSIHSETSNTATFLVFKNGQLLESKNLTADNGVQDKMPVFNIVNLVAAVSPLPLCYAVSHSSFYGGLNNPCMLWFPIGGAIVSAFLLIFLGRRLQWSGLTTGAWIVIGLLSGPCASIAAVAFYDLPALIECANCGKRRLVTKNNCNHCGSEWPIPTSDGAEVFDNYEFASKSVNFVRSAARNGDTENTGSLYAKGKASILRSLINKELALLRLPVVASIFIGFFYILNKTNVLFGSNKDYWTGWPYSSFTSWTFGYGIVVALICAFGQFFTETRSESARNFTIHRSVSSNYMFAIKAIAGLLAYSLVMIAILSAFYISITTRGSLLGPFPQQGWDLGVRDSFLGILYWFGMALIMSIRSHWYSWRLLPIMFCIGSSMVAHNTSALGAYILILSIATIALAAAACTNFSKAKSSEREGGIVATSALGVVLAGALIFGLFCIQSGAAYLAIFADGINTEHDSFLQWREPVEEFSCLAGNFPKSPDVWYVDETRRVLVSYDGNRRSMRGIVDGNGWHATSFIPSETNPLTKVSLDNWQFNQKNPSVVSGVQNHYEVSFTPPYATAISNAAFQFLMSDELAAARRYGTNYYTIDPSNYQPESGIDQLVPASFGLDGALLAAHSRNPFSLLSLALWPTVASFILTILLAIRGHWKRSILLAATVSSLLFGAYIPIIALLLYKLPPLVTCPICGKKRLVTEDRCVHCGAPWLAPVLTGIEIFELHVTELEPECLVRN